MKNKVFKFTVFLLLIIGGCSAPKVLVDYKTNAEQAETQGNYEEAVTAWKTYFEQQVQANADVAGDTYAHAAKTAYKAGMAAQAEEWFTQARYNDYAGEEMYLTLADIYRKQNNLSRELESLEYYFNNFSKNNTTVNKRLFMIYSDINMPEKALNVWPQIDKDSVRNEKLLENYFLINKKLENTAVADSVSLEILELNPENVNALEWNAYKYYWLGENLYEREMKKYEQNNTTGQYKRLLKQLDVVTANFQKALTYFNKLWELDPGKKYASYMANIYARFDEEDKASYYRKYTQ